MNNIDLSTVDYNDLLTEINKRGKNASISTEIKNIGTLTATINDTDCPCVSVTFTPEKNNPDKNCVDIAYIKGIDDKASAETDEKVGDISVYVFENPYDEGYTRKMIIKSDEISKALNS